MIPGTPRWGLGRWRRRPKQAAGGSDGPVARVAINMRLTASPWGGGNQWVRQMVGHLRARGYVVVFDVAEDVDAIVLVDPRVGGLVTFGPREIRAYRSRHPEVVCLHRVNECDARKGTSGMDDLLAEANRVADFTVFVSGWLLEHHAGRWFDRVRPHRVIPNGADPATFHPVGGEVFAPASTFRLVTHHWSDNWMKGFDVYQEVDRLIAEGQLPGTELWVIGRWPAGVRWRAAATFDPMPPAELGALLRRCHAYLTASRWDPGPMHAVEGAQCGLPLIYHEDGGGIVELGRRYGVGFRDDIRSAIAETRDRYAELRAAVLQGAPSGDLMCVEYHRLLQGLLARGAAR